MQAELSVKFEMKRCKFRRAQNENFDWTYLLGYRSVAGRSKIGNEVSVSIKDGALLTSKVAISFPVTSLFH